MVIKDTPIELILLMEADILDETGAMGIVWDCMAEGGKDEQSYEKTYQHIYEKSYAIKNSFPMVTEKAKQFWKEKQDFVEEFKKRYSYDLGKE
jgi:uncharacterized protein